MAGRADPTAGDSPSDGAARISPLPARHRGSQTLLRGFDILDVLAHDPRSLRDLAQSVGLTKTTTYRLAAALLERRYLRHRIGGGYCLGSRLLELKDFAERQIDLVDLAADALRDIARKTGDTARLAILDEGTVLYLGKVAGHRRLHVRSQVGERHDVATTALGRALILDRSEQDWRAAHDAAHAVRLRLPAWACWKAGMSRYVLLDHAFSADEDPGVRSLATPIRDVSGKIVAAISLTSPTCYFSEPLRADWVSCLRTHALGISAGLGWKAAPQGASQL